MKTMRVQVLRRSNPQRAMRALSAAVFYASLVFVATWAAAAVAAERLLSAFVTTQDGARIHYLHGGEPSARPAVVFIPGWTWTASVWEDQMNSLLPLRHVVAIDPRSQGDSSKTTERNTPEGRAADIAALLQQLGATSIVLVGWSQGVQDVAAYVDRFGTNRLAGVVLVDSSLSAGSASVDAYPRSTKQMLDRIAIYAAYPDEYLAGMMDASRTKPFTAAEKKKRVALARQTPTSTGISMLVADVLTTDRRGVIPKIDKPALVIASSTSDELDAQKAMAEAMPHGRLIVVKDAGHAVFLDQPAEFSSALDKFLQGLEQDRHDPGSTVQTPD
jgi:pimeloyl-ACP methyl ester carboxylesterase